MTKEDIQKILAKGESITLECKMTASALPKSVWETYSAFANTIGGTILLGVEEHKDASDMQHRFEIKGVNNAAKIIEDFWNTINSSKVNENILLDRDVEVVDCDGSSVIVINVPQADWRVKPVFLNENMLKGSYRRNHEGDYHCSVPKIIFGMPRPFKMEGVQRIDDTPQIKAIREAFTNSLIHCDILGNAGILKIEKYGDRLCFRNPGILLIPIDKLYKGGFSKARNPRIQNMLRMIGFGENVGSGFHKIISAWQQVGWKKPEIENRIDVEEVMLTLYVQFDLYEQKSEQKSEQKTIDAVYAMIAQRPTITRAEMAKSLGLSSTAIYNNIQKLKEYGRIKRIGGDKGGHWIIID